MPPATESLVVHLDSSPPEPLTWLWPSRIAAGKLALLDGDPEQGKSLLTLDLAARVSTGRPFPDGSASRDPAVVLLVGMEDGLWDTVVPRLRAAGADLSRIRLWAGQRTNGICRPPLFPQDCALLRETIEHHHARLVILDPFLAFLSAHACSINDQMVRQALTPLAQVAAGTNAAIPLVRHLTKGSQGKSALYRGTGAMAIIGAARTAFLLGPDPADPQSRILACTKTNLGQRPPSLGFRIRADDHGHPYLDWTGPRDCTADDLLRLRPGSPHEAGKPASADFLRTWLTDGPQSRDRLYCKARAHDVTERSLRRAKKWLKAVSKVCHHQGRNVWYWRLPDDPRPFDPDQDYTRFMEEFWSIDVPAAVSSAPERRQ
jgi:hypothetical protein